MARQGGVNGRVGRDEDKQPFDRQGCYYIESEGDTSRFRPEPSSRSGQTPSLHHGQEETVSINADRSEIKTDYILHDVEADRWFSVTDTEADGAGNVICMLAKAKGISS